MIEVLFSTAVSAALIASATLPMLANMKKRRDRDNDRGRGEHLRVSESAVNGMLKQGYAYAVDLGDSMVVVVVVEKKAKSFLSVEEEPISIIGIEGVPEFVEATT